jgi:hypothetical protein
MTEILHGILENSFGLVEAIDIDEVFIVEVHLVDAGHDAVELFFFGRVGLFHNVGLVDD